MSKEQSKNVMGAVTGAAAAASILAPTLIGLGAAVEPIPDRPQRPPAATAKPFSESPKQEQSTEIKGTGEHTGGRVSIGWERDNNGTLNTGEDGPEPGLPIKELIPEVLPNLVIGSSGENGHTQGDGWRFERGSYDKKIKVPVPQRVPGKPVERTYEAVDETTYPIESRWEQDFHTSPELVKEIRAAAEDCYAQIEARQNSGYLLTGVQIRGLASDEDNATRPGDPMANLGETSELNKQLANERGLAGMQTMSEVLQSHGIDPSVLSFLEGEEVQASPQEIEQILQYSTMLRQDPLEVIQDYNRVRTQGLQPLMDELFKGNRGIACIASFTKLETEMVPGESEVKMMFVPVEIDGKDSIWRIEIPGEVLLIPLLYMALRSLPGGRGRISTGRIPTAPIDTYDIFGPPPKEVGNGQDGHRRTQYKHKQPRPHNMNGNWAKHKPHRRTGTSRKNH